MYMKPRKHKRKESFSVLFISNTGNNSRQLHISKFSLRLIGVFALLVCIAFGGLLYCYLSGQVTVDLNLNLNKSESAEEGPADLLEQVEAQKEMIRQLEEEKEALDSRNTALISENKALLEAAKSSMGADRAEGAGSAENPENDPFFPSRYPYSERGAGSVKYSDDHPYVSIETEEGGNVIASGSGTISTVGSDADHPLIIEIEHGGGYQTRYMFRQEAESALEEGAQVQGGDVLVTVGAPDGQLDYQVIYNGEVIDPLLVFEAKG